MLVESVGPGGRFAERGESIGYTPLIYAGTSERRFGALAHCFPEIKVQALPGGPEDSTLPITGIMRNKIRYARSLLASQGGEAKNIIAADTQTVVAGENHGKPQHPEEVRAIFGNLMAEAAATGVYPHYMVRSASGLAGAGDLLERETITNCTVVLDPEAVRDLVSPEGFALYLQAFRAFYAGPPYHYNGFKPVDVTDLSAGISLPVLTQLGGVLAVNSVSRGDEQFAQALRSGIYTVAVGIDPHVLEPIHADPRRAIENWQWLSDVVAVSVAGR